MMSCIVSLRFFREQNVFFVISFNRHDIVNKVKVKLSVGSTCDKVEEAMRMITEETMNF